MTNLPLKYRCKMNKVNVVIIEDEIPAARLLSSLVAKLRPNWSVNVLQGSIENSVAWFAQNQHPDLIFLDIQLSDGNSFDFLSTAKPTSAIIFTTAYDQFAIRAFSVNSVDYILKPVDEKRLLEAIIKYESISVRSEDYLETILESLQDNKKKFRTRFLINGANKFVTLQVADVAYFYSENKVTFAVTNSGREYVVDFSLNKLTEQLDPDKFFRINRQVLICIDAIKQIEPYFNNKISITATPTFKDKLIVSEEKITQFKHWLNF